LLWSGGTLKLTMFGVLQVLMASGLLSGGSIRMEVPWCDSYRILLSKEHVRFPVDLAHRKIGRELERFLVV
jgi:tRNA wybutosine-synthesizing protein 3